ncbi:MAG TPA: ABC transporter substrate-binding protein [Candidatus Faecivicinus avistercoris]|nr:ABC transporter substrate-binding protein [Candidatus Faecivicinus avistercoris]
MKFAKTLVAMVLALAMVLTMSSVAMAEDAGTIKIGLIGPMTGAAASYGTSVRQGVELAVEEVNGLGGVQIELNAQDDEHDQELSINAYNTLWDWGAQMIIGCVTTGPCVAVGAEAYNDRMFMLTPSASSTDVIADKDNVYQLCFTDPAQGSASAQYISEHGLGTKIAVIYNNADAYSTGIYQTFEAAAAELGLEIVSVTTFTDDTTDFSVQVTEAREAGADLVFLPIYYTPASMILQQANSMDYAPVFFGVDGMDGILNIEGFDTSLAEGVMLLTPFSADATDDLTVNFVTKYEEAYGATPDQFAADGYDCVYTLYAAINEAGITADMSAEECCDLLIAAMQNIEITGVTGTMTWSATGEVTKTPTAVRIENGVYVGADVAEEAATDEAAADEVATEEAATDEAAADEAATDEAVTDEAAADEAATEEAAADEAATDEAATEEAA